MDVISDIDKYNGCYKRHRTRGQELTATHTGSEPLGYGVFSLLLSDLKNECNLYICHRNSDRVGLEMRRFVCEEKAMNNSCTNEIHPNNSLFALPLQFSSPSVLEITYLR